jgi:hypothetical protein
LRPSRHGRQCAGLADDLQRLQDLVAELHHGRRRAPRSLRRGSVSQYATASRTARYLRQCRNMRHCRLRSFELRCAKGPGPLGAPLDEGACERQAIQPPQRRLFSWETQGSALACANPNLCDFSKRRIFTLHIEVRIRYAQPRSRSPRRARRRPGERLAGMIRTYLDLVGRASGTVARILSRDLERGHNLLNSRAAE